MLDYAETNCLISFLDELANYQGNAGCNDWWIKVTEANLDFLTKLEEYSAAEIGEQPKEIKIGQEYLNYDWVVTHYLIKKLRGIRPEV